eukprot:GHVU01143845.1.p1 GENE.GHVU01143845.1~~GHVU01143845.1.p1  ORF type:complete len:173 (+),score=23.43 GHVU01143845.1:188-706(+)
MEQPASGGQQHYREESPGQSTNYAVPGSGDSGSGGNMAQGADGGYLMFPPDMSGMYSGVPMPPPYPGQQMAGLPMSGSFYGGMPAYGGMYPGFDPAYQQQFANGGMAANPVMIDPSTAAFYANLPVVSNTYQYAPHMWGSVNGFPTEPMKAKPTELSRKKKACPFWCTTWFG